MADSAPRRPRLLTWAALCLITLLSTGCQFGSAHHAAAEPHYAQLEQACFGYEPTVWRKLPGQCEQAVRMIPDEVVQVPAVTPATPAAPPTDTKPGESVLDQVPEPGQGVPGLLRGILDEAAPPGETESPPAEPTPTPSANEPAAPDAGTPKEVAPSDIPPQELPSTVKPAAEPAKPIIPPAAEPSPPQDLTPEVPQTDAPPVDAPEAPSATGPGFSRRQVRKPITSVAQRPVEGSNQEAASELFRSVEQALVVKPSATKVAEQRPANKTSAIGLARFISY